MSEEIVRAMAPLGCAIDLDDVDPDTPVADALDALGIDISGLLAQHELVVIRGACSVGRDPSGLVELGRRFGSPVANPELGVPPHLLLDGRPEIFVNSNNAPAYRMPPPRRLVDGDVGYPSQRGWHHDQSFVPRPPAVSILYGHRVTPVGGETCYVSTSTALRRLPARLAGLVRMGLKARHAPFGLGRTEPEVREGIPPAGRFRFEVHEVLQRSPLSGAPVVFLSDGVQMDLIDGPFVGREPGLDGEGFALLEDFLGVLTDIAMVYVHEWEAADIVIHDNFAVAHCPTWFEHGSMTREMWRVTVDCVDPVHSSGLPSGRATPAPLI